MAAGNGLWHIHVCFHIVRFLVCALGAGLGEGVQRLKRNCREIMRFDADVVQSLQPIKVICSLCGLSTEAHCSR